MSTLGSCVKKRAVIYNRCSTEKEVQENAIVIQEQESIRACEEHGWEIVHIYKELESGKYADIREEYQKMLRDIQLGKFDIIVVKCQDRIMRNVGDWCQFVELLNESDIQLYFYMDNKFYDYENDELLYGFTMQMHAFYSKNLAIKIKQSHRTRQLTLAHVNINHMYGWDRVDMYTFVINETEAKYIRRGYQLLREGHGFHTIANILYEEGARSKKAGLTYRDRKDRQIKYYSEKIAPTTWRKMLYSPSMYGTAVMNKQSKPLGKRRRVKNPEEEWIYLENAFPAIVTKEYFEETIAIHQNSLAVRNCPIKEYNRSMSAKGKHAWSGIFICECCGSKYYRMQIASKDKSKKETKWRCSKISNNGTYSEENPNGCKNIVIEEKRFNELISSSIDSLFGQIIANKDCILETVLVNIRNVLDEETIQNELKNVQKELTKQNRKKEILFEKLISELISDADFRVFNEKLKKEISDLSEQEKVLKERQSAYNNYDARNIEIRNALSDGIIKQAITNEIIKTIRIVKVHTSGLCKVYFDKERLFKVLRICNNNITETMLETLVEAEFVYTKLTVYETRRAKVNQLVLEAFHNNPHLRIQGVADLLSEKYSYIYTSVVMLKKENKLQYKYLNTEHAGIWIVQDEPK